MAVSACSSTPKPPAKPVGLEVKVRTDKSLHIRWPVGEDARRRFQVEVCYFDFEGPIIDPFHSTGIIEVEKCAAFVPHPEPCATGPSPCCEGRPEGSVGRWSAE